jgi:DNA polymerase-3 subunit epsilon/ATP-dependent DNA helicase DinG
MSSATPSACWRSRACPSRCRAIPVFAARSEGFDDPFADYSVPHAILRFKQGFGRLIRSATDRGVCAVLDRRVLSKRYGRGFIDSLPPCSETRGPIADLGEAATAWLNRPRE